MSAAPVDAKALDGFALNLGYGIEASIQVLVIALQAAGAKK